MNTREIAEEYRLLHWAGVLRERLERGGFQWPRTAEQVRELTAQQYRWLMEGLAVSSQKR